jgi:hypothetical protein
MSGLVMITAAPASFAATSRILDAHNNFLLAARDLYAANVTWIAPARNVRCVGREEVIRHLLREASGMYDPEFTFLRRNANERQMIDEFAVRFIFAGEGIDNAPVDRGDFVELKRVRILELHAGKVAIETCIENWTVLLPHAGPRPWGK